MKSVTTRAGRARVLWLALGVIGALGVLAQPAWAEEGFLGVELQDLTDALAEALDLSDASGVLVTEVVEDSPAAAAGLRRGDVIVGLDGTDVRDSSSFTRKVRRLDPGDEVALDVLRRRDRQTVTVTLGDRDDRPRRMRWSSGGTTFELDDDFDMGNLFRPRGWLGVRVEKMNPDLGRYFGTEQGLLVMEVYEDSGAAAAGVQIGDVILAAEGSDVADVDDLHDAVEDFETGDTVTLEVLRDGVRQPLAVEVRDDGPMSLSFNHHLFGDDGMRFFFSPDRHHAPRSRVLPRRQLRLEDSREDLEEAMEELRRELRELRQQLKELSDG